MLLITKDLVAIEVIHDGTIWTMRSNSLQAIEVNDTGR
jgi:hypothetical protein